MTFSELAAQALADLGPTRDQVAQSLTERHITGWRGDPRRCPVGLYLGGQTGGLQWSIWPSCADEGCDGGGTATLSNAESWADLPPAVSAFVRAFDRGEYPNLITRRDS
jgi:hypothetical protein